MKKKFELEDMNNNTYYKRRMIISKLGCPMCQPGHGCNRSYKDKTNWKSYRKHQYRS